MSKLNNREFFENLIKADGKIRRMRNLNLCQMEGMRRLQAVKLSMKWEIETESIFALLNYAFYCMVKGTEEESEAKTAWQKLRRVYSDREEFFSDIADLAKLDGTEAEKIADKKELKKTLFLKARNAKNNAAALMLIFSKFQWDE